MRNLFCSKLALAGIVGSIAFSISITSSDARRAYDSSGSAPQTSPPQNPYSVNQFTPPQTNSSAPQQNRYAPQQNQYTQQQQVTHPYPHQTVNNGTNFYGMSPEQMSGAAVSRESTIPANSGRGGYDPRWNPNFGTGAGAQVMARESGGLTQALRENFPLPISGDEAQMFQVNDFAARANGAMQRRGP